MSCPACDDCDGRITYFVRGLASAQVPALCEDLLSTIDQPLKMVSAFCRGLAPGTVRVRVPTQRTPDVYSLEFGVGFFLNFPRFRDFCVDLLARQSNIFVLR